MTVMSESRETRIREALMESSYVTDVFQLMLADSTEGTPMVGARLSLNSVSALEEVPPVLALLRRSVREVVGAEAEVFIEADAQAQAREDIPTEAIVILGYE